jgi:hypothetical protein
MRAAGNGNLAAKKGRKDANLTLPERAIPRDNLAAMRVDGACEIAARFQPNYAFAACPCDSATAPAKTRIRTREKRISPLTLIR